MQIFKDTNNSLSVFFENKTESGKISFRRVCVMAVREFTRSLEVIMKVMHCVEYFLLQELIFPTIS